MDGFESIFRKTKDVWEKNLSIFPESKLQYPDENLVRLFSGRYVELPSAPAKIMDHGFGHGNSLLYAAVQGYECAGCEISINLIDEVKALFERHNLRADLRQVEGLDLPFDEDVFDIVLSWNVIHYNGTRGAVEHVISELRRIMKPGGVLLLSTISKNSSLYDRMEQVEDCTYRIVKESVYDNRLGLTFFVPESESYLASLFNGFTTVRTGSASFNLFKADKRHDTHLIYAVK